MYKKKNRFSQPVPILDKISLRLSDAVYRNINEKKAPFFFKTFIFDRCFGKCRLIVHFYYDVERCLYFLEYALASPPSKYCFLVFKYISVIDL